MNWISQNKEWLFSGIGVSALLVLWMLLKKFILTNSASSPAPVNQTTQAPTINVSPTFNLSQESRNSESSQYMNQDAISTPPPVLARANLKVEATKIGTIFLQGDIWTLSPGVRSIEKPNTALMMDIANVPTPSQNIKAITVKAVLTIQSRTYSPLPWLEEYTNTVRLGPAARKTIVVAVGSRHRADPWYFVLNHRDDYNSLAVPSRMDWTNHSPIFSDLPLEILLVDVKNGELVAQFEYLWMFDANLNFPVLKSPR